MKYAYWGIGLITLGMFGIIFIVMFESITINNESEYYVLREAMEAAMLESVDFPCYSIPASVCKNVNGGMQCGCGGTLKISEQKFVENFTRRFAASISGDVTEYEIEFYDIIESPPKATVLVRGKSKEYMLAPNESKDTFFIENSLSGILEVYDVES